MKIYLLRHGESVDDVEDCFGGIADFPLTDAGRTTAQELGAKLSGAGIEVLYTSPYRRAYDTATIIGDMVGCDVTVIRDLRERNSYGVLSGVNKSKAKEIFSHVLKDLNRKPGDYYSDELVPGAEPREEFAARVKRGFEDVIRSASGRRVVAVVTHGNVTRAIYQHILGIQGKVELDLLAITVIEYHPVTAKIERKEGVEIVP